MKEELPRQGQSINQDKMHPYNPFKDLVKSIGQPEKKLVKMIKSHLTRHLDFVKEVIPTGSMQYGTALKGVSDFDMQVKC